VRAIGLIALIAVSSIWGQTWGGFRDLHSARGNAGFSGDPRLIRIGGLRLNVLYSDKQTEGNRAGLGGFKNIGVFDVSPNEPDTLFSEQPFRVGSGDTSGSKIIGRVLAMIVSDGSTFMYGFVRSRFSGGRVPSK
jgi:hypothetical protein